MLKTIIIPLCAASVLAGATLSPALAAPSHASVSLIGAGSTFDQPFFDSAFTQYQKSHHVSINYQPVGSGAGIAQFTARTADFGASDVPMNPLSELPLAVKAGGAVSQVPITLGGVSIAYNVKGVKTGLKLNSSVLAGIYLGLIKSWNAKQIKALNKGVKLPSLAITVVHRSDGSGTSYIFSDYLAQANTVWRGQVGASKTPNWPVGVGGKGNPGVAQIVQQTNGAIGYVELAYVLQNKMHEAELKNGKGQYLFPTPRTVAAAAASFKHVSATNFSIVNSRAKGAYPIVGYSWVLLFHNNSDASKGQALKSLFKWMVTGGQKYATRLDYVALPKNVQTLALSQIAKVR